MKLNTRVLAFVTVLGAAAVANAQDVNFWLAYGDAASAAKNGKAAGDELVGTSDLLGITTMKVRLMATGVNSNKWGAGGTFFAFDNDTKGGSNYTAASGDAGKANFDANADFGVVSMEKPSTSMVLGSGLPGVDNSGGETTVDAAILGSATFSGSFGAGTTLRPVGLNASISFGTGFNLQLNAGTSVMLAEYTISINQAKLQGLGTFGDSDGESGLMIFAAKNAASRSTYLGSTSGTGQASLKKYAITAVPEPATMIAMAAGLVALARRRRK